MSSHGESETCHFGHTFVLNDDRGGVSGDAEEALEEIKKGKIRNLDHLKEEYEDSSDVNGLMDILGSQVRALKVSADRQGPAYGVVLTAADKYDEDLEYTSKRVTESIFVSPQSQLHDEFMQRKQQAEQRINQTLSSFSDLMEQKHLLEHDIRKLRSRAEAINSKDEDVLKGDFVQLVDGAGAGGQGADEQALRFLRDNNIYPTIVADFMEMESVDDLKKADNHEDVEEDGDLAELPRNEKAILRKKFTMYQKWKDIYGSEVNRRLKELKAQLRNIEQSIQKTKDWLEPYVRDVTMINEMGDNQTDMTKYYEWRGNSGMERNLEFICYKPLKNDHGNLVPCSEDEATHYRVMHIFGVQVITPNSEQPNQPGGGSTGVVQWRPAIVCKHVFERFFEPKIDHAENLVEEMHSNYVGDFNLDSNQEELKSAREGEDLTVRELREAVQDELDEPVPIEFSSKIRRVEDGLDKLETIEEDRLEAIEKIIEPDFEQEEEEDEEIYTGVNKEIKQFTGQTDEFYLDDPGKPMKDMMTEFRFEFYFDFKIGFGMHTMK